MLLGRMKFLYIEKIEVLRSGPGSRKDRAFLLYAGSMLPKYRGMRLSLL
jgi:hypothetical protein